MLTHQITETLTGVDVVDLTGRATLLELCPVVAGGHPFVANESDVAHLALLVGAQAACVAGGGHYGWFVPNATAANLGVPRGVPQIKSCVGCYWRCNYALRRGSAVSCVQGLSVEAVWSEVDEVLRFRERAISH